MAFAILDSESLVAVATKPRLDLPPLELKPAPQTNLPAVLPGTAKDVAFKQTVATLDRFDQALQQATRPLRLTSHQRTENEKLASLIGVGAGTLILCGSSILGFMGEISSGLLSLGAGAGIATSLLSMYVSPYVGKVISWCKQPPLRGAHLDVLRGAINEKRTAIETAALARAARDGIEKLWADGMHGRESRALLRPLAAAGATVPEESELVERWEWLARDLSRMNRATDDARVVLTEVMRAFSRLSHDERCLLAPVLIERLFLDEVPRSVHLKFHDAFAAYRELRYAQEGRLPPPPPGPDDPLQRIRQGRLTGQWVNVHETSDLIGTLEQQRRELRRGLAYQELKLSKQTAQLYAKPRSKDEPRLLTVGRAVALLEIIEKLDERGVWGYEARRYLDGCIQEGRGVAPQLVDRMARIHAYLHALDHVEHTRSPEEAADGIRKSIKRLLRCDRKAGIRYALERSFHEGKPLHPLAGASAEGLRLHLMAQLERA